jgi:hypothetical protein
MSKRNTRILRKLGYPVIDIINEESIDGIREEAMDEYTNLASLCRKEHGTEVIKKWVEDYTLALCKISIGRTIGRVSKKIEIDYDKILTEGLVERQTLRDFITNE